MAIDEQRNESPESFVSSGQIGENDRVHPVGGCLCQPRLFNVARFPTFPALRFQNGTFRPGLIASAALPLGSRVLSVSIRVPIFGSA